MKYPFVFYVDSLPPDVGGCANGFVIRILKKYKDDYGIYKHELVHVKQWFYTFGLHSLMYLIFDWYRMVSEVEAYAEQLKHYPDDRTKLFAEYISKYYKLNVTQDRAEELLNRCKHG